ncbi:MAG: hypothetical protein AMS26_16480 [Bacteroides sp. SM23_62]|nr:MAG: hypothetical protein AMS26_16480 [Bacteroides sp. SM23_62]
MRGIFFCAAFAIMWPSLYAQVKLDYYLPLEDYLPGIPEPGSVIGHPVGEWHLTHDKLTAYLSLLARESDRVIMQEYARSWENRPLFHLIITAPANHAGLEQIREEHLKLSDSGSGRRPDPGDMPVVVRLGYNVHGNESSAANASVLVAYYLAASRKQEVLDYLDNMVILLDPCLNPDGFNRHASWINMHKSRTPMPDDNSRGFREVWPGGRTNHYWFDLNRDWILLRHPETRGRVEVFHRWRPNVQTDHHEMGSASTFFFQPGIQSRTHPYTPEHTTELTRKIGQYHAAALDPDGSLFFTEEIFDDFYYGKGSSYPDVNGCVGILFEQAGTRGFERNTSRGKLTFPYAIRNQVRVSLSTLKASFEMREELLEHQRDFYSSTRSLFDASKEKAYIFGDTDRATLAEFVDILLRHRIRVFGLKQGHTIDGITYAPGNAYIVPLNQPQFRLVQSLFRPLKTFADSLFYDVSAWTLPYAFNIPYADLGQTRLAEELMGEQVLEISRQPGRIVGDISQAGYVIPWHEYYAPGALYRIQDAGLMTQVATEPFEYKHREISRSFGYGSIFIPVQKQINTPQEVYDIIGQAIQETGVIAYSIGTSHTSQGMDMGSSRFVPLEKPALLLLTGEGVNSLEAGEIWHLLDARMQMPVVLIDQGQLNSMDLSPYTHLLMPSGSYDGINASGRMEITRWVSKGGTIIALNAANRWLKEHKLADIDFMDDKTDSSGYQAYGDLGNKIGAQDITGSIFESHVDISHPIGYGLRRQTIPVFRNHSLIALPDKRPFACPVRYTADPLLSGYVPEEKYDDLRNTPVVLIGSHGSGRLISFIDNPNFRGFWYGTNKLFLNAIFFGPVVSSYSTR